MYYPFIGTIISCKLYFILPVRILQQCPNLNVPDVFELCESGLNWIIFISLFPRCWRNYCCRRNHSHSCQSVWETAWESDQVFSWQFAQLYGIRGKLIFAHVRSRHSWYFFILYILHVLITVQVSCYWSY